jgi:hypothetical protein
VRANGGFLVRNVELAHAGMPPSVLSGLLFPGAEGLREQPSNGLFMSQCLYLWRPRMDDLLLIAAALAWTSTMVIVGWVANRLPNLMRTPTDRPWYGPDAGW